MCLSHIRLTLIFKLLVRSKVCDEYLVSLFKWSIEAIFASNYSFVYFDVQPVIVL